MSDIMQYDGMMRVMLFTNLVAVCEKANDMTRKYTASLTNRRALLMYNNPDEFGSCREYVARLPLLPSGDDSNPFVVLHVVSDYGGRDTEDREAAFYAVRHGIFGAPALWRDPQTGKWEERHEPRTASNDYTPNQCTDVNLQG